MIAIEVPDEKLIPKPIERLSIDVPTAYSNAYISITYSYPTMRLILRGHDPNQVGTAIADMSIEYMVFLRDGLTKLIDRANSEHKEN